MEEDSTVVATYMFRGIEYVITMNTLDTNTLVVEVEDRLTADQWRGSFDSACKCKHWPKFKDVSCT